MDALVGIASFSVLSPGETPDVSFAPPASRRRLSPLQKVFFHLAHEAETTPAAWTVFASAGGEDALTRRIVADFQTDGSVSPQRFSASVYNAAPGLWSVLTKNRAPYTAIAADESSVEAGLIEALTGPRPTLFVAAEEADGGIGAAALFTETAAGRAACPQAAAAGRALCPQSASAGRAACPQAAAAGRALCPQSAAAGRCARAVGVGLPERDSANPGGAARGRAACPQAAARRVEGNAPYQAASAAFTYSPSNPPISLALFSDFLRGAVTVAAGRWLTLRRLP